MREKIPEVEAQAIESEPLAQSLLEDFRSMEEERANALIDYLEAEAIKESNHGKGST